MEGLDQEFKLAIEETQELAGKAATYSLLRSGKPSKMDIKATQYYRFQVNQRIEHIQEMMEVLPFKTNAFYLWKMHKNILTVLSIILSSENLEERLQGLQNYHKVLEKFKNETSYLYWKEYISTNGTMKPIGG